MVMSKHLPPICTLFSFRGNPHGADDPEAVFEFFRVASHGRAPMRRLPAQLDKLRDCVSQGRLAGREALRLDDERKVTRTREGTPPPPPSRRR